MALSVTYTHLDPSERDGRVTAVADALIAGFRKTKNDAAAVAQFWDGLAELAEHLDRPGSVQTAVVALAALDQPSVQQIPFLVYEKASKKLAARMAEHGLWRLLEHPIAGGGLQRAVLAALAGSKDRAFRNTWEYLDRTDRPPPGTSP